jgi:L-alanine-DL-glutamate epimerase-like enolase superfamily enzyme
MDIAGKALEMPSWKLLGMGEKYRDEVPIYASVGGLRDTPRFSEFMKQRVETGYQSYKLNVSNLGGIEGAREGGVPTQKGLEVWGSEIRELREIIGHEVNLGAQAFGHQTARSAIEVGEFMAQAPYSLAYIEEMVPFRRFNSVNLNRQIVSGSPTPNQAGENIFSLDEFAPFVEAGALDIVHPDMLTAGGMIETKRIADYADRHGIETMIHAAPSPVGLIAKVHCAATIRSFRALEYQFRWPQMPWWGDLVSGVEKPIIQPGGAIPVPEGPGLGIEFNEEVAEKYLMEPEYLPFDPGLFEPTSQFDEPMRMLEAKQKGLIDYDRDTSYSWWHLDENLDYGFKPRGS